ncbi:subtilisin-like serine protease [Leptolyngbya sp. PCC 7375]|nr:subtilisin-like serine protease [Leptolyngbya sp. PCC 7375]
MSEFEHLELPKTSIELPRRSPGGFGGRRADRNRGSHGRKLLDQAGGLVQRPKRETSPFRLNPKLIFKLRLSQEGYLSEDELPPMGLTLLAQEPNANKAIVVFSDDEQLSEFRNRLDTYSSADGFDYAYLDAIEDLVPLEPQDRIGRLLALEPLQANELAALDLELWHTGDNPEMRERINELDHFLTDFDSDYPMRVSDRYIGDYLCLARVKLTRDMLEFLLEEDFVKEINRRPKPSFEASQVYNLSLTDLPEIVPPPETNCGVLVIDSGVQRGHPLISPALGDADVFPDAKHQIVTGGPDDGDELTGGHGTGVAGVAVYGTINQCIQEKYFQPHTWLFSARVTNENNEYDPDSLLENQLGDAVQYFINAYPNCKVINISLGDSNLTFREGQKQFALAARIDELAYEYRHKNLVFVISAGNFRYAAKSDELVRQDYPGYLLQDKARIIEPATSALALTVGSLSFGTGNYQYSEDAGRNAIAKVKCYPSPFTRSGFGVDGMIKPELVDFGGDLVLEGNRLIPNEPGVAVLTLAKNFSSSLFRSYCGTSFAAPRIANLAARLFTQFPNASSNLIRALIANSAAHPDEIPAAFQGKQSQNKQDRLKIYGYGQPSLSKAQFSTENRVVLLEDNQLIPVGKFQMYEIPPFPDDYLQTQGTRTLSITLAFDPPTRPTRGDSYLGVTMEFHLFKNISRDIIVNAFVSASKSESPSSFTEISLTNLKRQHGSGISVELSPGINLRKKGTLQKGEIEISSRARGYDQSPLYLVVCCNRKWAKSEEIEMQRYALVASISHSNPEVDLYNQLRLRTRIVPRLRV